MVKATRKPEGTTEYHLDAQSKWKVRAPSGVMVDGELFLTHLHRQKDLEVQARLKGTALPDQALVAAEITQAVEQMHRQTYSRAAKTLKTWKDRDAGSQKDFVGHAKEFEKKVDALLAADPPYRVKNGRRDQWKKHSVAAEIGGAWVNKSTADNRFNHREYGHFFKSALDKLARAPKPPTKSSGQGRRTS